MALKDEYIFKVFKLDLRDVGDHKHGDRNRYDRYRPRSLRVQTSPGESVPRSLPQTVTKEPAVSSALARTIVIKDFPDLAAYRDEGLLLQELEQSNSINIRKIWFEGCNERDGYDLNVTMCCPRDLTELSLTGDEFIYNFSRYKWKQRVQPLAAEVQKEVSKKRSVST